MKPQLVLSLFPGYGLLDFAYESEGFTVVRGPDLLFGGDIRNFCAPPGKFNGVIGGPPCQVHSTASVISGTSKVDLIPEFVRVVNEAKPDWVQMENVPPAIGHQSIPKEWNHCVLRDWDCGGKTKRKRAIWTWPFMIWAPGGSENSGTYSLMASTYKRGKSDNPFLKAKGFLPGDLSILDYAELHGVPHIGKQLVEHKAGKPFAVTVLGNGVPFAMGKFIARAIRKAIEATEKEETTE